MEIDWTELKTADGNSIDIQKALELLCSSDEKERKVGYWMIDNHAILQSDLYEAAYYVIAPLFDALNSTNYKKEILNLLIEIATGFAPSDIHININGIDIPLMDACQNSIKAKRNILDQINRDNLSLDELELINELIEIIDDY